METSTKNLNFEFIDNPILEDFTNGTIDFVFNGRTINIISGNAKYNKNIIAGNSSMKNPYTGINSNHGNDGDGYAIITFIGDKLD